MRKSARAAIFAACLAVAGLGSATGAEAAGDRPTIGVVVPTFGTEFWVNYVNFMKRGAEELGVELVVLNADNNSDRMIKSLEDLAARDVDGMIFTPYWSTARRGLAIAADADIPVVMTDSDPELPPQSERHPHYIAFVGPSDEDAGYQMAKALFAATAADGEGRKHIGVVNGTPGTAVATARRAGLERALKEHPEIVVAGEVNGDFLRDTAQSAFESLYQGNPQIRGMWAANGGMANGIMAALKNAGKAPGKDVHVVAMDLNRENLEPLRNGELEFDIGGHWLEGGFAMVVLYDAIKGHVISPEEATVKLSLMPLTRDGIPQYLEAFPDGVPAYDFKAHSRAYTPSAPVAAFEMTSGG